MGVFTLARLINWGGGGGVNLPCYSKIMISWVTII